MLFNRFNLVWGRLKKLIDQINRKWFFPNGTQKIPTIMKRLIPIYSTRPKCPSNFLQVFTNFCATYSNFPFASMFFASLFNEKWNKLSLQRRDWHSSRRFSNIDLNMVYFILRIFCNEFAVCNVLNVFLLLTQPIYTNGTRNQAHTFNSLNFCVFLLISSQFGQSVSWLQF